MMEKEFPYLKKGDLSYPMVDIELNGPKGSLKVKALVDSGATFSIFRKEIADYLGIPIKEGQGLYFQGIKTPTDFSIRVWGMRRQWKAVNCPVSLFMFATGGPRARRTACGLGRGIFGDNQYFNSWSHVRHFFYKIFPA